MFGNGFWNRQLQLLGHLVGNRRSDHSNRRVDGLCGGDGNDYRNIGGRHHQVRLGNRERDGAANDHFRCCGLLSSTHPDDADLRLHTDSDGYWEL